MAEPMGFQMLLGQAATTFQNSMGYGVTLSDPVVIKNGARSLVVRCKVKSAGSNLSSLIIKHIKADAACGFSDWASLAFLSNLTDAQSTVPRFYGGDISARIFLMEDLGDAERGDAASLQDILSSGNPATVRAALRTLAIQMARLHAGSVEKEEMFESIRAGLPGSEGLGRLSEAKSWLDNHGKVLDWFKAMGYMPPPDFQTCLSRIADVYARPDGFLGFTHGDPAPTNNHFAHGQARLVDFEYGGFRHVLYDITAWNILCPLPGDCVLDMNQCFRHELAKTYPAAREEALYAEAWAFLCAYRALAILTWIPPDVINHNRPWADNWTMREAVLAAVSRLEQATAPFGKLEPVSVATAALTKSLHSRWNEFEGGGDILPPWPVFATGN